MSKARQLADLLDSNGDVVVGALDNAPDPDLTPYARTADLLDEGGNVKVDILTNAPNPIKAGTVAYLAMSTAPTGWLKANGATLSRTTYADLFSAIGTTYGSGDGSTTFEIPDLRGEFLRSLDDGRGVDSSRTLGSSQAYEITSHSHNITSDPHNGSGYAGDGFKPVAGNFGYPQNNIGTPSHVVNFAQVNRAIPYGGFRVSSSGGSETRPRNIALLACIKY